jgi:uncharacterized delta-60 repeat protein
MDGTVNLPTSDPNTSTAAAMQSDGKTVVAMAGAATPSFSLIRLNPDGSLDTSFGDAGTVRGLPDVFGILDVSAQSDGKIVLLASTSSQEEVIRFNPNGAMDATFGIGGVAVLTGIDALKLGDEPDGKLVIAGEAPSPSPTTQLPTTPELMQLNADGSLNTSFGSAGMVLDTGAGTPDVELAIQPDGKILIASVANGAVPNYGATPPRVMIRRFNEDGTADKVFGRRGQLSVRVSPGGQVDSCSIAASADGTIWVASSGHTGTPVPNPGVGQRARTVPNYFGLLHLTAEAKPDRAFGRGGRETGSLGQFDSAFDLTTLIAQPDKKVLLVCNALNFSWNSFVARFVTSPQLQFATRSGHVVTITASSAADSISISQVPAGSFPLEPATVRVELDGVGESFDASKVDKIRVVLGGHSRTVDASEPFAGTVSQFLEAR